MTPTRRSGTLSNGVGEAEGRGSKVEGCDTGPVVRIGALVMAGKGPVERAGAKPIFSEGCSDFVEALAVRGAGSMRLGSSIGSLGLLAVGNDAVVAAAIRGS